MEGSIWIQIVFPIAMLFVQSVLAVIGTVLYFMLQRHFDKQDEREARQDKAIKEVARDLADYKETAIAELFPRRDDYILQVSKLETGIEGLTNQVGEIKGYLDGRRGG